MTSDHGKKHRAGHVIKTVLAVIGGITVVLAVLLVALAYELNYAVRTVDTSTSPDGRFTLELQAVGEPLFFSPADARLVLRLGRYEVSHVDTSIADDGGQVRTTSWQVSWENSGAKVRLKGSEQSDELVTMGFDGSVSRGRAAADESLGGLPDLIRTVLSRAWQDKQAAAVFRRAHSALFLGRGVNSTTAYEGALKLKEISYLHAEAYPAGEMKHGPIALLEPGFPVVAIVPEDRVHDKTVSNIQEVIARGATCVAVATDGDESVASLCEHVLWIPPVEDELLVPIVAVVHLQVLARYVARSRGCDVDKPRNLAKSVTVE